MTDLELVDLLTRLGVGEADRVKAALVIRAVVRRSEDAKRKILANAARDVAVEDDCIARARAQCPHPAARTHPDPSGGSDRWTECLFCGGRVS